MGKLTDAVESNEVAIVRDLLAKEYENSPLINEERDADGFSALEIAAFYGYGDIIKLLLEAGAKFNQPRPDGTLSVYIAASQGRTEALQILMDAKADIHQPRSKDGATPLLIAAQGGHTTTVQTLLAENANIHHRAKDKRTAVDIADKKGHKEIVKVLLAAKAEIHGPRKERLKKVQSQAPLSVLEILQLQANKPDQGPVDTEKAEQLGHLIRALETNAKEHAELSFSFQEIASQSQAAEKTLEAEVPQLKSKQLSLTQEEIQVIRQITTLQVALEKSTADQSIKAQLTSLQEQLAVIKAQHEVLWKEYQVKLRRQEALKQFQKHPNLLAFYRRLELSLGDTMISIKAVSGGFVDPKQGALGMMLSLLGFFVDVASITPLIGNAIEKILNWTTISPLGELDKSRQTNIAANVSSLVSLSELSNDVESIARQLTERYAEQLQSLSTPEQDQAQSSALQKTIDHVKARVVFSKPRSSAQQLAVFGITWMLDVLYQTSSLEPDQTLEKILLSAVFRKKPRSELVKFWKKLAPKLGIEGIRTKTGESWQPGDILTLPGVKTDSGEYFAGPSVKPETYGWRLGSIAEAQSLGLSAVPAPKQVIEDGRATYTRIRSLSNATDQMQQVTQTQGKVIRQQGEVLEKLQKTDKIAGDAHVKALIQRESAAMAAVTEQLRAELRDVKAELEELRTASPRARAFSDPPSSTAPTREYRPLSPLTSPGSPRPKQDLSDRKTPFTFNKRK